MALFVSITICICRKYLHGHSPATKTVHLWKIYVFAEQIDV